MQLRDRYIDFFDKCWIGLKKYESINENKLLKAIVATLLIIIFFMLPLVIFVLIAYYISIWAVVAIIVLFIAIEFMYFVSEKI